MYHCHGDGGLSGRVGGWGAPLRVQASYMHPILLAKVRVWAAASGGCFPTAGQSTGPEQNPVAKYNRSVLFKWAKVSLSVSR